MLVYSLLKNKRVNLALSLLNLIVQRGLDSNKFLQHLLRILILTACFGEMGITQSTTCVQPAMNGNNDPWSEECYLNSNCGLQGNPCTANDVGLLGVYLGDIFGNSIPTCQVGDTQIVYIWGTFINNTGTNRYAIRTRTEIWINGAFIMELNSCSFNTLMAGTQDLSLIGSFTFVCGEIMQLKNTWIGWETSPAQCSNPGGNNYNWRCGQYSPSKCFKELEFITFLTPNFSYACGDITLDSTEVCFTDLTQGGTPPYSYKWKFGDGDSSTLQNPCHNYAGTNGMYTVTLTVTDSLGVDAGAFLTLSLDSLDCCSLDITCPSINGGYFTCLDLVPDPVLDTTGFKNLGGSIQDFCDSLNISHSDSIEGGTGCLNDTLILRRTYLLWDSKDTTYCDILYKVADTIIPGIQCPINVTVSCANQIPSSDFAGGISSDNCGGTPVNTFVSDQISAQTCANRYTITRTYRATDDCGNSANCTQIITVNDQTPPSITCPAAVTVSCANQIPASDITGVTSSDNCGGTPVNTFVSDQISAQTCANKYTITRTYRAADDCGNSATCTQIITVNDQTPPSITCPATVTVSCANQIPASDITGVTSSDNCGGAPVNTFVSDQISAQTCANRYTITRTYRATDDCGNSANCTQIITVNDQTPPSITCPAAVTVSCANQIPASDITGVTSSDNCGGTPVNTFVGDQISNQTCANSYTLTRSYRATDFCGNSATCSQIITVIDTVKPVLECPVDTMVFIGVGNCEFDVMDDIFDVIQIIENCDGMFSVVNNINGGSTLNGYQFEDGVHYIEWTVTDICNNFSTCSFEVTIPRAQNFLACKNLNISLGANCLVEITPRTLLTNGVCAEDVIVELSHYNHPIPNPVDSHYLGKTIIGKVTDTLTGNSCWSYVTIEDKLAPEIICRDQDMSCIQFNLNAANPAVIEDCSRYTVTLLDELTTKLDCNPEYIKEVRRTWISTDTYGNISDTCVQLIRVERPDINAIIFPDQIVDLECSRISRFDANGNPHPSITGIPTLEGYQIWPNIDFICNMYVDYEDQDLGDIGCVHKIMRTWRAREWWCNQEFTLLGIQFIQIKDTEGPIITHRPYDFDATTGHRDCEADVLLPALDAYDRCHDKLRVDISYPGGSLIGKNGGKVILPVGRDTVIYRIYDGCYNVTTDTLIVTVKDDTEPVAICDRRTVVALNDAGINWVPAEVFDDGSFDECHLHHFEVRRMDADACGIVGEDDWGPEVGFCCEDVGRTIMVAFKAIDASGNESVCMVSVEVQDKDVPLISCPPDILVDCRFDIDLNNLGTSFGKVVDNEADREKIVIDPIYWHIINGHPQDGIAYDNCSPRVSERIDTSGMNQCGMGLIIREFTVTDGQGNSASCVQSIEIQNHHPMTYLSITWPADLDTNGICNPDLLIPERLSAPYNFPTYVDDECSLIGLSYHDHVFSQTVPGDPCFKIFRVWKLIDWCQRDEFNNIVIFSDTQIIKVSNLVDPIITKLCRDTTICSYDVQCRPIPISLSIDAIDDCTDVSELLYRYKVDLNSDGTIDIERATIGDNTASGTWPLGRHIIKWEVEDRCGNTAKCQSVVNLLNCKSPTAYCHRDLSIGLTGMDTDGNGTPDTKMAVVWASDLNVNSGHSCGYPVTFSFSADTNDKSRTYTCDSIGPRNVELWVTDINGNTSVCKTVIIIWDNPQSEPQCPQTLNVNVNGQIKTEGGSKVEKVGVLLEQSTMPATSTNFEGEYAFGPIATGGSYAVKPGKNDDWLNGISTADIVKIQKHILGTEPITSPYKMVAADVNRSKTVTARDIADLRKLILGLTQEISGNTSWRFVDEYYSFASAESALTENFPEVYSIPTMSSNTVGNFIGIKVGDVNESAKTRGYQNTTSRSGKVMDLSYRDEEMKKGNVYEIEFNSSNIDQFRGFQMTMEWNAEMMEVMEVTGNRGNHFGEEHYSMHKVNEGKITFSWDGSSKSGERLFTVKVRAKADARVSDVMHIGSSITPALSIGEGLEEGRIELRSQGKLQNEFVLLQNEPNPWNGTTVIGMLLPEKGEVKLTIYDMTGKVYFRSTKEMSKGYQEWIIEKSMLSTSGVYYYQVDFDTNTQTRKMIILE